MTKATRQAEINSLLTMLHWLTNGGNSYSLVGRERQSADPIFVSEAIAKIKNELALVIGAKTDD